MLLEKLTTILNDALRDGMLDQSSRITPCFQSGKHNPLNLATILILFQYYSTSTCMGLQSTLALSELREVCLP